MLFLFLIQLAVFTFAQAEGIDNLKADFLRGNYRRVIFEAQKFSGTNSSYDAQELNYILGLSYLKEGDFEKARESFERILNSPSSKFKAPANLGIADVYLAAGRFKEAEDIYAQIIADNPDTSQKASILYRQSQLEFSKGDIRQGNECLLKLKKEFPLSPELSLTGGFSLISPPAPVPPVKDGAEYFVQIGFFTDKVNANRVKNKLLAKKYPVYIENSSGSYRVKVGRFKNLEEALDLEKRLSRDGFQTKVCP